MFIIQQAFIRLSLSTKQQVEHPSEQASRLDQYLWAFKILDKIMLHFHLGSRGGVLHVVLSQEEGIERHKMTLAWTIIV